MATVERFEDLEVWKRARELANMIYDISEAGTFARDYGLREQMRRAAISILSNIAEGFESRTQALFIEFLGRAKASAGELRAQLYIAIDRRHITQDQFDMSSKLVETCSKQITRFMQCLETKPNARQILEEGAFYDVDTQSF